VTEVLTFLIVGLGIPTVAFIVAHFTSKRIDFSYYTDKSDEPEFDNLAKSEAYYRYEDKKY